MPTTYYSNCVNLTPGCLLYSTITLTIVPPGKYSDGVKCWTVGAGGLITGQANCPPLVTTTTTVPPGCLVSGTMINMLDGSLKSVEEIVIGDSLLSIRSLVDFYNNEQLELIETRVLSVATYTSKKLYSINDGLIISSEGHIHIVKHNGEWGMVKGVDLQIGDVLINNEGNQIIILSIDIEEKEEIVYNIDVDNQDVYFANNILTHNKPNYVCCSDTMGGPCTWQNIASNPSFGCVDIGMFDCFTGF
jgi:hypothetical protein